MIIIIMLMMMMMSMMMMNDVDDDDLDDDVTILGLVGLIPLLFPPPLRLQPELPDAEADSDELSALLVTI